MSGEPLAQGHEPGVERFPLRHESPAVHQRPLASAGREDGETRGRAPIGRARARASIPVAGVLPRPGEGLPQPLEVAESQLLSIALITSAICRKSALASTGMSGTHSSRELRYLDAVSHLIKSIVEDDDLMAGQINRGPALVRSSVSS